MNCWQEQEFFKYMLVSDVDNIGIWDFQGFKEAIKLAQKKSKIGQKSRNISFCHIWPILIFLPWKVSA